MRVEEKFNSIQFLLQPIMFIQLGLLITFHRHLGISLGV